MDTSYYYNFIILVQTGNMTQAAEILHITQPALSKQLKYLEAEFGTPLLVIKRGQRGASFHLTEAGRIFYEKAQQLCSIEESTYADVKRLSSEVEGTLRIASSASRSTALIQQYLHFFSRQYPVVRYEIYEGLMTDVTESLLNGSAEIGLCNEQMVDTNKFDVLYTQTEDLYALFRKDLFWTDRDLESISWKDISKCPLSLSGGSVRMLMQAHHNDFSSLNVISVTTTKSSAIEWAQSGRTIAIIPMDGQETVAHPDMTRIRLSELTNTFYKAFITIKGQPLSMVAQQFLEFYKAHAGE